MVRKNCQNEALQYASNDLEWDLKCLILLMNDYAAFIESQEVIFKPI